jgi:biotin carboxyl carrier protein
MLFYIHHQGREYKVRVESRNDQYFVCFGDEPEMPLDIRFYGQDCTLLHHDKVFAASIVGEKTDWTVFHSEGNLSFQVESEYRRIVGLLKGLVPTNENNVYARMPGKIVKVLTRAGVGVLADEPILIMEAMKMENEIRSPVSGQIIQVVVKEGQAVETGALLVEITPTTGEEG